MLHGTCTVHGRIARWAFSDRTGGSSATPYASRNLAAHVGDEGAAVRANRVSLEQEFDVGPLSWMGPVHGTEIAVLTDPVALTPNVDALATSRTGVPLVALGADCVPLLLAAGDLVVAAHIGWQGFADGMTDTIIATLAAHDVAPSEAQVLLGPAICGACYGIPQERADAIATRHPGAVTAARSGGPGGDIRLGLAHEWRELGAAVTIVGPCTFEAHEYFSHRRDGVTGRQGGVIAWTQ